MAYRGPTKDGNFNRKLERKAHEIKKVKPCYTSISSLLVYSWNDLSIDMIIVIQFKNLSRKVQRTWKRRAIQHWAIFVIE